MEGIDRAVLPRGDRDYTGERGTVRGGYLRGVFRSGGALPRKRENRLAAVSVSDPAAAYFPTRLPGQYRQR